METRTCVNIGEEVSLLFPQEKLINKKWYFINRCDMSKGKPKQIRVRVGLCFFLSLQENRDFRFSCKIEEIKKPIFKKSKDFGCLDIYRRRESYLEEKYQAKKNLTYGTKILCKEKKFHYLNIYISLLLLRRVVVPTHVKKQSWFWSWSVILSSKSKYVIRRKIQSLLSHIRRATWCGQKKTKNLETIVIKTLLSPQNSISPLTYFWLFSTFLWINIYLKI